MTLGIRDLTTTILAAATAGILYVQAINLSTPVLTSHRWSALLLLALGISMCVAGSRPDAASSSSTNVTMGILGGLATVAGIWTLIAGSHFMVMATGLIILAMWLIAIVRHAVVEVRQPA